MVMRKFDEWETRHLIRALEISQIALDENIPDWDDVRNKSLLKTFRLSLKKKLEWKEIP
tara:strand:- start:1313 stop:1489 length:177 start_codon:yes stop_codon:yes gene_type:complete